MIGTGNANRSVLAGAFYAKPEKKQKP